MSETGRADDLSEQDRQPDRDSLRRALRNLEAAEARVVRNAERVYDDTRSGVIAELLPVSDNLDRAIAAAASCEPAVVDGSVLRPAKVTVGMLLDAP